MIGKSLSHFEITAKLGAGGMGEVYRATDTKLGREVAIKVLPETVSEDPARLARFEREAKVLAALNHPHIAGIYSLESAQMTESEAGRVQEGAAVHFLVMELAEGEDLAHRLGRGPLALDQALPIALQIADALEAAHERGIIHRDLKPANVKVDADGNVKVLDFGLAKALDPNSSFEGEGPETSPALPSISPTLTAQMTGAGAILGTAAYMSPEQAKGKTVDKRSDIWSFGVVLWEMLTGRKLFGDQETVSEAIAAVLTREPDLHVLPARTPLSIRYLLARCLVKEPKSRLRDIGDARLELQTAIDGTDLAIADTVQAQPRKSRTLAALLVAAISGGVLGTAFMWLLRPSPAKRVIKLEVPTENLRAERVRHPLISPDGTKVLVPDSRGLVIRSLDKMSARPISHSIGARYPCWSPDSQSVAFVVAGEIRKVSLQGGDPSPVASLPADVGGSGGMVWTPSGHFLVAGGDNSGILQVPVQGGEFREILSIDKAKDIDFHEISLLPNGRGLAFVVHRKDPNSQVRLVDTLSVFANGERKDVLRLEGESIQSVVYSPPGYLLFHRSRTTPGVWALPFSLAKLEATGEPFLVAADSWLPSASRHGTLLLVHGLGMPSNEIVQVDRQGTMLRSIGQIAGDGEAPHLSPDGRRLAVTVAEAGNWDVWIYDLERATRSRFTFESTFDVHARWSPAGDEILYAVADMRKLKIKRVDGSDEARTVGDGLAPDWIPDGSGFIFEHYSDETDSWNISYKLFDEDHVVPLLATSANEISPRI
ncbi:MAG: protein kinase, partial [Thermoanaerobaculia bacterium]